MSSKTKAKPAKTRGVRSPLAFKKLDLMRAIRAAKDAGMSVAGFEIDKSGRIAIKVGAPADDQQLSNPNPWDTPHVANEKRST